MSRQARPTGSLAGASISGFTITRLPERFAPMSNTPYNPADQVDVDVTPALTDRNRLTCAFRVILAIPHILLVGGPIAFVGSWVVGSGDHWRIEWGAGTGVLGAVASVVAV